MTAARNIDKRGRPPRPGVPRYQSGAIVNNHRKPVETPDEAKATALEARVRQVLGVDEWLARRDQKEAMKSAKSKVDNPLLAPDNPLGRLLYVGRTDKASGISRLQYSAGAYFGWLYRSMRKIRWGHVPEPKAVTLEMAGGNGRYYTEDELDLDHASTPEQEQAIRDRIKEVEQLWSEMYRAIMDADDRKGKVFAILRKVLIDCSYPRSQEEIGDLRTGLNAINKARGIDIPRQS